MRLALMGLTVVAALTAVPNLQAQEPGPPRGPVRGGAGAVLLFALPVGEFRNHIDQGFGAGFDGHYNVTSNGAVRLRLDVGFIQYGSETQEGICFSSTVGCRVRLDLTTSNSIAYAGVGPELMLPRGFVRPYVNGGLGFSYFTTDSHVSGDNSGESFGHTTHYDDTVFAVTGGGGLYIPLRVRQTPLAIDLSARYHHNGTVRFLSEGDIQDLPDGSITFTPRRSQADLVTLQLGVSVGIRSRGQ